MKISTKGKYGISIMITLAKHYPEKHISIKDIASEKGLSEAYLEQLMMILKNAQLVESIRGANGGYKLIKDPKQIKVSDIFIPLEGPIEFSNGEDSFAEKKLWNELEILVNEKLSSITLQQLLDWENSSSKNIMFYI